MLVVSSGVAKSVFFNHIEEFDHQACEVAWAVTMRARHALELLLSAGVSRRTSMLGKGACLGISPVRDALRDQIRRD